MATPLLKTKLYIPRARPELVSRPRLLERVKAGLHGKLTLLSAPAGFGKTTLLSDWIHKSGPRARVAWLSLDEGDNDAVRFWTYVAAALGTIEADTAGTAVGEAALTMLQSARTWWWVRVQSIDR